MEPQSDDIVIYDVLMVNRCCFKITVGEYMFLVPHWSLDLGFIGKQVISQSFVKKKKTTFLANVYNYIDRNWQDTNEDVPQNP